jgi:hypothetical protein
MRRIALGLLTLSLLVAASSACFARGGGHGHGHGHNNGHSVASPVKASTCPKQPEPCATP